MMTDQRPSVAELFDLLGHPRRRATLLLVALAPEDGIALRTIADMVYAAEHDVTPARAPTREVTNLRGNLTRSHLETLEDGGLISIHHGDRLAAGPSFGLALCVIALGHAGDS